VRVPQVLAHQRDEVHSRRWWSSWCLLSGSCYPSRSTRWPLLRQYPRGGSRSSAQCTTSVGVTNADMRTDATEAVSHALRASPCPTEEGSRRRRRFSRLNYKTERRNNVARVVPNDVSIVRRTTAIVLEFTRIGRLPSDAPSSRSGSRFSGTTSATTLCSGLLRRLHVLALLRVHRSRRSPPWR